MYLQHCSNNRKCRRSNGSDHSHPVSTSGSTFGDSTFTIQHKEES